MGSIFNRRFLALLILGMASGLPFALIGSTLSAWFTQAGKSVLDIGMLSLVGQPYVFKFLWSPLLDRYIPPLLGRRCGWILMMQICLILSIFTMSFFNPMQHVILLASCAMLVAFFSASQDIAISAYLVDICPNENQRGAGASASIIGWRCGAILSGAFALILAQHIGFAHTYQVMSILMLIAALLTLIAPEPDLTSPPKTLASAVIEPIKDFFGRHSTKSIIVIFLIFLLYKFGDAFLLSMNTTFLHRALGFSWTDIATANKMVGMIAAMLGGLTAGIWMSRISLYRALVLFGSIQAMANLSYVVLAMVGHHYWVMASAVFIEYFCSAMGSIAFVAFTMSLCNHHYSAAQYSIFNALESTGRVYVGPLAGIILSYTSWVNFYWISFIVAWPVVLIIILNKKMLMKSL